MSVVTSPDLKHHISGHTSGEGPVTYQIHMAPPSQVITVGMAEEEETLQPAQQPEHCGVLQES